MLLAGINTTVIERFKVAQRCRKPWTASLCDTILGSPQALPPSSPPIVEHDIAVDERETPSLPESLAGGLLSPEIARFPPPRTPGSGRGRFEEPSSEYYTAIWGSPYEYSPSRSVRTAVSEQIPSDELSDSSPIPNFGLENLIPRRLGHLSLPDASLSPPEKDRTGLGASNRELNQIVQSWNKRWIQLPQPAEDSQNIHWWSDQPEHTESDRNQKRLRRTLSSISVLESQHKNIWGHKSRESNRTINQQSFWNNLRRSGGDMSSLYNSRWATTPPADETTQNTMESGLSASRWAPKPPDAEQKMAESSVLTPPWVDSPPPAQMEQREYEGVEHLLQNSQKSLMQSEGVNEAGSIQDAIKQHQEPGPSANEVNANATEHLPILEVNEAAKNDDGDVGDTNPTPVSPSKLRLDAPRLKKKVSWRGKTCVVSIPNLDYDALGLVKPLSFHESQARLMSFEEAGYNIAGFDMPTENDANESAVYSRPMFPDELEIQHVLDQKGTIVRLPDLAKWATYMDQLTEQKLAALGVSIGSEEPTPVPSPLGSRQASAQYPPLPFSPPIPSSSAGNLGRPAMVRGHSHTMSVASPISPLHGPFGHMHRHSTFTGSVGFPQITTQQLTQQSSTNAIRSFSPQQQAPGTQPMFGVPSSSPLNQFTLPGAFAGGPSAQLAALRSDLAAIRSTGSPLSQLMHPRGAQDFSRGLGEDQPDRQNAYPFPVQQSTPTNANNPNTQPTPSLPQLAEEDEEPEEVNESKQESEPEEHPEPGAYLPPHKRAELNANIAVPMPRGHRHNISAGLERDILESEKRRQDELQNYIVVEEESSGQTSQSESYSAPSKAKITPEKDPLSQDYPVQEAIQSHKKSASRFNVAAPAFKFNPGASFQPTTTAITFGAPGTNTSGRPLVGHSRQQSSGTFNVAAPEFKPAGIPSLPRSEFSFSTNGPSFGPNAVLPQNIKPREPDNVIGGSSIFGKIEIPEFVKPTRRSKAVTIRKPDESTRSLSISQSEVEDEEGRIAQSQDRLKRQRKVGGSGDQIPKFAEPTPIPAPPEEFILKSQQQDLEEQGETSAIGQSDPPAADPLDVPAKDAGETVEDAFDHDFDLAYGRRDESDSKPANHTHKRSTSLSALAKPFQPHTASSIRKAETTSTDLSDSESELEEGELKEDVPPPISPLGSRDLSVVSHLKEPEQMPKVLEDIESRLELANPPANDTGNAEPSFDEIDAVMRQLNEVDGDQSAQEGASISPLPSPGSHPMPGVTYLAEWTRSDAPSPSPSRRPPPVDSQADSSFTIHERTDSVERGINERPQVTHLNKAVELPTSDWSADFSVHDDEKLHQRSDILDSHIDNLIGRVLDKRLQPLEESLRSIHNTVNRRPNSRDLVQKRSSSAVQSDADDEDETSEEQRHRPISRGRDKKIDQIKAAVVEALREQSPQRRMQSSFDLKDLHSYLADMKASFARAASSSLELDDIRAVVEDAVVKQSEALVPSAADVEEREELHRRQKSELEARLNQTLAGMLEEANLKRAAEEREAESRRMLQQAEDELRALRNSSQQEDTRLATAEREKDDLITRLEQAENSQRDLEQQIKNLEAENAATYATLEEYRMSSSKWRQHIDQATQEREDLDNQFADVQQQLEESQESNNKMRHDIDRATREREEFQKAISTLELQLEESQESGGSTRRRLEKLHSDMATAAGQLASEKSAWKAREEEYRAKCDSLEAQVAAHHTSRSKIEEELRNLRASAEEASEARSVLDQMKTSNASLDDMVRNLQNNLAEQQNLAAGFERDFNDAKEAGRAEVHRVRISLEADVEAANHQVNVVRAELEGELSKLRIELENVKLEAESAKGRHERLLAAETAEGKEALRKLNDSHTAAFHEARQKHETSLQELQVAHKRAMDHASEDKQRADYFANERLALSDAKLEHFQDKVLHLEERLEVAKSAAQAAAMSAQSRAAPIATVAPSSVTEKVSPQALRESILVLQEQLQDRESLIERLQNQIDHEAPAKIKSQDDEIAWLRELLTVRSEELTNLVNTLAQPTFDRHAVRDAAIRIRANLQMEQQEKERSGQQSISEQAMAGLSNFATPKATQLTTAFNKWRSTMESSALKNAPKSHMRPRSNTPVKDSNPMRPPPGYMSGLMTPPASNLRSTPSPEATGSLPALRLHSRPGSKSNNMSMSEPPALKSRQPSTSSEGPTTPLFRSQSYDQDAEDSQIRMQNFEANFEDDNLDEMPDNQPPAFRSLESELENAGVDEAMA